jgi:hypothetical protein
MFTKLYQKLWQDLSQYWWNKSFNKDKELAEINFRKYMACIDHKFNRPAQYSKFELIFGR